MTEAVLLGMEDAKIAARTNETNPKTPPMIAPVLIPRSIDPTKTGNNPKAMDIGNPNTLVSSARSCKTMTKAEKMPIIAMSLALELRKGKCLSPKNINII